MNNEQQIDEEKIGEISDTDFGSNVVEGADPRSRKTRPDIRCCLFNECNEICVLKSEKYGFYQLPGGGVEPGEALEEALRRETIEETGWEITDIEPVGYIVEHRERIQGEEPFRRIASHSFRARTEKYIGTNYAEDEKEVGFKTVWMSVDAAIAKFESFEGKIKHYSGCFANRRDLLILKALDS